MQRSRAFVAFVAPVAFALFACAGCGHKGSAKLEGHWKGTRAEGVGVNVQDAANAFATGSEITAKGNQIAISTPGSNPKKDSATYVIDDEQKTSLTLHTDKDGASNKETFAFADDGKTMSWKLGDGRAIVFAKQP